MYKEDFVCIFALCDFYPNTLYTYLALLLPLSHHPSEWYLTPVINFYSCFNLQWLLTTVLLVWWPNSEAQKQLTNHTNNHTQRGALKLTSVNAGKLKNVHKKASCISALLLVAWPQQIYKGLQFLSCNTNTEMLMFNL